jgi:phosphoribosylglycinamide formyltransferase-1
VLAGYLKKIPNAVTKAFPQKIINIHPALLPSYGGAGMYGMRVHEAVVLAGEKQSGITIHFVDEVYDQGEIIFQASCDLDVGETAITLAEKVLMLEHEHYSKIISNTVDSQNPVK